MFSRFIIIISLFFFQQAFSKNIIEVYGVPKTQAQRIIKNYSSEISQLLDPYLNNPTQEPPANFKEKKNQLLAKIKKDENLLFINLETLFYQQEKNTYTLIDAIAAQNRERLNFVNENTVKYAPKNPPDLIDAMVSYQKLSSELFLTRQFTSDESCPFYHCTVGFNQPQTKPYLTEFKKGAETQKNLILTALSSDPMPQRREAAAFLIGHFDDPKYIMAILAASLNDKDFRVRNAAMRVIASTMVKAKIVKFNIEPVLNLLNSPYETDRNKALAILLSASTSSYNKDFIISHAKDNLLQLLALKQPNDHHLAYLILKNLSGKNYTDTDICSWQTWLNQPQKNK